jgi:hypothetical protein
MRPVIQLDDGDDLATAIADHVIDPLLRDAISTAVRTFPVDACRVEQGRHGHLGEDVMVRQGHNQPAEEFHFIVRHDSPAFVAPFRLPFPGLEQYERREHSKHEHEHDDKYDVEHERLPGLIENGPRIARIST